MLAADASDRRPSGREIVTTAVKGYVVMVGVLIALGFILRHTPFLEGVRDWDLDVSKWLEDHRTDRLNGWTGTISRIGDAEYVIGSNLVLVAVLAAFRWWWPMALLPLAILVEVLTFLAVNYVVRRERPAVSKLGAEPSTFSFPSGHVAAALVMYLGIAVLLRLRRQRWEFALAVTLGTAMVLAMGYSRLYRGMHYFLDIVVGLCMGGVAWLIAIRALRFGDLQLAAGSGERSVVVAHPAGEGDREDGREDASRQ